MTKVADGWVFVEKSEISKFEDKKEKTFSLRSWAVVEQSDFCTQDKNLCSGQSRKSMKSKDKNGNTWWEVPLHD